MNEIKIGHVIKRILEEQRRSLKQVSRETGIPYSTLHTWHENRQPKDIMKAQKLAKYFGISLHRLLFDLEDTYDNFSLDRKRYPYQPSEGLLVGAYEVVVKKIK